MRLPSFLDMYAELVAVPSISATKPALDHSNRTILEKIAGWCESIGFKTVLIPIPGYSDKFNLLAKIGEGTGGLVLSGHSDTVPCDPMHWHSNPFQLTEQNNRLYGLGTVDMKSFFAFILDTIRDIDLSQLKKPLYLLATADEETTMAGAIHFAETSQIKPDCIIIGEPTGLVPIRAHKGQATSTIKILGQSGHSSDPSKGVNAIEIMSKVIDRVLFLRNKLQERYHNPGFEISHPTLNLGHIHGGDAANRICECCELVIDIRPLPGMSFVDVYDMLRIALRPVMQFWPNRLVIHLPHDPIPGYECNAEDPQLKFIENATGKSAQTVNYCTEAPFLNQIAPTFILGPGSIEQAHQPNEYLSMEMITPALSLYKELIYHFCQESS